MEKGWLQKHIEDRNYNFSFSESDEIDEEKLIYKIFQPTGILYGHPIKLHIPNELNLEDWSINERIKIIFADCSLFTNLNTHVNIINQGDIWNIENSIEDIVKFYQELNPRLRYSTFFLLRNTPNNHKLEKIFDKRVVVKAKWNLNFWQGFFQNILLFSDILIMLRYISEKNIEIIKSEHIKLNTTILKVIAATAFADKEINKSEVKLFNFFVESSNLDDKSGKKARNYMTEKLHLEDLGDFDSNTWLEKKYILELAIITLWADRSISEEEENFIKKLAIKMGFDEIEALNSFIAVESFVLSNWDKIHYLRAKQNYLLVSQRIVSQLSSIALKYKRELAREMAENKELIQLIGKSRVSRLTIEEKEKVRLQLIDILKSIPAFVIIAMPFSFFALPILLKIIPKSAFPSSFDENKLMERRDSGFISE